MLLPLLRMLLVGILLVAGLVPPIPIPIDNQLELDSPRPRNGKDGGLAGLSPRFLK